MKRQKVWAWIAVVLAMGCLMSPVHAASVYTDPQGRFSLTVPDGFTQASDSEAQFTSESPVIALFSVVVLPNTDGFTLDQTAAQFTAQLPDLLNALNDLFDDVQVVPDNAQPTMLGGQPAQSFTLIATTSDVRLRLPVIYTIAGGNLYAFIYGGLDDDFPTVQREVAPVIASFKFRTAPAVSVTPTAGATRTSTPQPPPTARATVSPVPTTPVTLTPATPTSMVTPQAVPTQPIATGPTGLPEPPFIPRRLGNG